MYKRALNVALICLLVAPLNSRAANSQEIDGLIAESQSQAQESISHKVQENQKLILEITQLENQINELMKDIEINRRDVKRDLIIAGGTTLATLLAMRYFGRPTGSEVGDQFRLLFGFITAYAGLGSTVVAAGASGVNYVLVKVDENKLPELRARLQGLKQQAQAQNQALLN